MSLVFVNPLVKGKDMGNTANKCYVYSSTGYSLGDLINASKQYFGEDVNIEDITVTSELIPARHINYILYSGNDCYNYIILELKA